MMYPQNKCCFWFCTKFGLMKMLHIFLPVNSEFFMGSINKFNYLSFSFLLHSISMSYIIFFSMRVDLLWKPRNKKISYSRWLLEINFTKNLQKNDYFLMSSSKRRAREIFIRLYTKLCPMYDHKIFLIYLVPDNSLKLTLLEASKKK